MLLLSAFLFVIALLGTLVTIRSIIAVARIKHLFDEPSEERKIHVYRTPNLGGVGMYCTFIFSTAIIIPLSYLPYYNSLVAASMIIFAVGLKDDLVGLGPTKKFLAQIFAALIIAYLGDVRITSFYGLLGVQEISYPLSILLTVLINIFVYNAINLIDGIDGLAGGIGLLASITYAVCFYLMGAKGDSLLAIGFASVLVGFLYYNISPAKTFMGDTGSLFTGFMLALFSIRFIELNKTHSFPQFKTAPAIALAVVIIPVFDTIRVFLLRILRGRSPFVADSNHVHHRFLNMSFTHMQATGILLLTNIVFIITTILLQDIGNAQLMSFIVFLAITVNFFFWNLSKNEKKQLAEIKQIHQEQSSTSSSASTASLDNTAENY